MILPDIDPGEIAEMSEEELADLIALEVGYSSEAARLVAQVMKGTYDGPPLP